MQHGVSQNGEWRRQDFVFEYLENENQRMTDKVLLSVMGDKIDQYKVSVGDEVRIGFWHNIETWQGRIYNRINLYKYEVLKKIDGAAMEQQQTQQVSEKKIEVDDLPY